MEKKKKTRRIILAACAVVVVALLAATPLLAPAESAEDGPQASILSGTVGSGTVQTTLLGGGTLTGQEAVTVTVPSAVKLTGWLVENGSTVSKGDALATTDRVSVMEAIARVQESLDYLAEEIEGASGSATTAVTAKAGGTVKLIYAQAGDNVRDVMLEHGALAVLSLDGLMSVSLEASSDLAVGSTVAVTLADGTAAEGRVESNLAGKLVITLEDEGYAPGQTVQVEGLGSGELVIHSPWNATAYTGTVQTLRVTEGRTVSAGDSLMTLQDTGSSAAWQQLVDKRREYEQLQLTLFTMYQTGHLAAPCDGIVSGLDESQMLSASLTLLANAPNGDDETAYTNFLGKVAAVGENGWAMAMDPREVAVTDYKVLVDLTVDEKAMTELVIYDPNADSGAPVPVYELAEGEWVQVNDISAGDVLLFAANDTGDFVWIVRLQKATQTPQQPSDGQTGGNTQEFPSFGGTTRPQTEEEEFTLYDLTEVTVATVTPNSTVTVDITVDERDILKLSLGQSARVTVDALGGAAFDGVITDIGSIGTSNGGSSKFTVQLTLERTEEMLSGMTATAAITLDSGEATLTLPVAALVEEGTRTVVYTGYDEKNGVLTDPVTVETGASDGENVAILSGLSSGDTFYYAYYDTLEISNAPDFGSGFSFGR